MGPADSSWTHHALGANVLMAMRARAMGVMVRDQLGGHEVKAAMANAALAHRVVGQSADARGRSAQD